LTWQKIVKRKNGKKALDLKARGQQGAIYFMKPDTTVRVRILSMGEENDFIAEVIQFYLGL